MHFARAQRIDGHRRDERGIDTAREAEHDAWKSVLGHVVLETEHASRIRGPAALLDGRNSGFATAPALGGARPIGHDNRFTPCRQLRGEAAVGIQNERRAVEHQLILPANLIDVDQWHTAFRHPRDSHVHAQIGLRPIERRTVRRDQDFRARLSKRLDNVFAPDVFANRHTDPHAAHIDRPRHRPCCEHAFFVEHTVVRKIDFQPDRFNFAAIQQRHRVVNLSVLAPDRADQNGRTAAARLRQVFELRPRSILKRRFQHQIFRWVAVEKQLRKNDQIGTGRFCAFACASAAIAALPARSPTTGFNWASAILREFLAVISRF